jgi:hypothetical protein
MKSAIAIILVLTLTSCAALKSVPTSTWVEIGCDVVNAALEALANSQSTKEFDSRDRVCGQCLDNPAGSVMIDFPCWTREQTALGKISCIK